MNLNEKRTKRVLWATDAEIEALQSLCSRFGHSDAVVYAKGEQEARNMIFGLCELQEGLKTEIQESDLCCA